MRQEFFVFKGWQSVRKPNENSAPYDSYVYRETTARIDALENKM